MLVWLGDFNYRIDGAYESVKERAIRNELGPLLELVGGGGEGRGSRCKSCSLNAQGGVRGSRYAAALQQRSAAMFPVAAAM